ncbi:MAG: hypothetical protein NTV93_16885 [Verrucomicrobia bacterium]|nr:hypothetical protein [Verrucomicrobiota bacterium]
MSARLQCSYFLSVLLAMSAGHLSAALLPAGVTVDKLTDTSKWASTATQGTIAISTQTILNGDPLDPADTRVISLSGWPEPAGTIPGLFAYKAPAGYRISKVRLSICNYDDGAQSVSQGVGIADSSGHRISSVPYNATFTKGVTPWIRSAASYSGITPVYTKMGMPNPVQGTWQWYMMEVDLPESAVSLIDGHTERFNALSVGFWDWNGWTPYVGTVELTVVPAPVAPASITVTAPNGFQRWDPGDFTPMLPVVSWNSQGVENVRIDLYKGGLFFKNLVASMPAAFGTYTGYTIDNTTALGGDFRVRVSSVESPAVFDDSDNAFVIKSNSSDNTIVVTTTIQRNPSAITLHWPSYSRDPSVYYEIFRRPLTSLGSSSWGPSLAGGGVFNGTNWVPIPGGLTVADTSWTDTNVTPGVLYEYKLVRSGYADGYVAAGIDLPMTEDRGTVVLLVDDTMSAPLAAELLQMKKDLVGDGWKVVQHDAPRKSVTDAGWKESVVSNKALIKADALADPNVKAVSIIGHVAIPYSGNLNPDGHAEHKGAWPADGYYGDLSGSWTDSTVNNSATALGADFSQQRNVPGDGKFDQSSFPAAPTLAVGRVDLQGMSSFALSETELLRQYLIKDHNFRHKLLTAQPRVIIDENFSSAYAMSGYQNSSMLGGESKIDRLDYLATLKNNAYLFACANGGGALTSAQGVGSTADIASNNPRAIFTELFGSYFGDWDHTDSFLRAPLATTYGLTCIWGSRPNWTFHPMGMGRTTGDCARLTMNSNAGFFDMDYGSGYVHISLLGDPTLRLHVVPPVTDVASATSNGMTRISWSAPEDPGVVGYHVYRATSELGPFTRLTGTAANAANPSGSPITTTLYTDTSGTVGMTYMVRAVKNENGDNPGGSNYFNLSQGVLAGPQVVANYESEIKSPAESAALGWTYFTTDQGGSNLAASLADLWSLNSAWQAANKRYTSTYGGVGLVEAYAADCAIGVINPFVQPGYITPGDNGACFVARWTSDVTATSLNIAGSCGLIVAESGSNYGTLKFLIRHNGGPPQLMTTNVYNDTAKYSYSHDIANVVVGDTIDLIVWGDPHNWETKALLRSTFSALLKVSQTIAFGSLPAKTSGDPAFALGAAASSGLAVTYASSNPAVVTITGNMATIVGPGTSIITASQPGDASFNAAPNATQTLTVNAAATPMQGWLAANSLPTDATGNGAPGASPAGDGIKNQMKFALGIDAWISGYQGHLAHGSVNLSGKDYLTLTYKSPEPAVASCTVKTSADLVTWSAAETVGVSSSAAAGIRTTTVRDSISIQDATRRFIRLEVGPQTH